MPRDSEVDLSLEWAIISNLCGTNTTDSDRSYLQVTSFKFYATRLRYLFIGRSWSSARSSDWLIEDEITRGTDQFLWRGNFTELVELLSDSTFRRKHDLPVLDAGDAAA